MHRDHAARPAGGGDAGAGPSPPANIHQAHLGLLAQDPHHLFVWWHLPERVLPLAAAGRALCLRIYEASAPGQPVELEVGAQRRGAVYLPVPGDGRTYVAELGLYRRGIYRRLLRSLPHSTPWGNISPIVDPAWPPLEELYRTIRPRRLPSSAPALSAAGSPAHAHSDPGRDRAGHDRRHDPC